MIFNIFKTVKKHILYIIIAFIVPTKSFWAQSTDSLYLVQNQIIPTKPTQEYLFPNGSSRTYSKPSWKEMFTRIPKDFIATNKNFVAKDHAWYLAGSLVSTVALIPIDQQVTDESRALAQQNGMSAANHYGKFGPLENIPKNLGAGLYLIGNGTTVIVLSAGFITYGLIKDDYRAQATASGLMESIAVSGLFVQPIKRMTGRESPFIAVKNGHPAGEWSPFPSFAAYAKNTPYYDAMPSGHLTTIMAALTVITTNYPEYKWIKPVGYAALTGMSLQMIQSQVHWVSDYPLAIFMGYFIGKSIANNRFTETKKQGALKSNYKINYTASKYYDFNMLGVAVKF